MSCENWKKRFPLDDTSVINVFSVLSVQRFDHIDQEKPLEEYGNEQIRILSSHDASQREMETTALIECNAPHA